METMTKEDNIAMMVECGFDKDSSIWALTQCDNNIEEAINFLSAVNDGQDQPNPSSSFPSSIYQQQQQLDFSSLGLNMNNQSYGKNYKMVLVIREDLNMTAGKIASQCVHAALGIYRSNMNNNELNISTWQSQGEPVICLSCKDDKELDIIINKCLLANINYFELHDAGRTQVEPG
jgi:peptidyl-tRNA hydrolase